MQRSLFLASALLGASALVHAAGFQLSSPDIKAGSLIDKRFEFDGFQLHRGVLKTRLEKEK